MLPTFYKVKEISEGILSVMAKPVPGEWIEEEFSSLKKLGIDKVVSLLEDDEQYSIGLGRERELCLSNEMEYASFPIADRGLPDTNLAIMFAKAICLEISSGKHIVIHCRAGIGRTGIIAGAVLIQAGYTAREAFELISEARGVQVPDTEEQEKWLKSL